MEEFLTTTSVEMTLAVVQLEAQISDVQSLVWMEVAELEEDFAELDRLERALQELRSRLQPAAADGEDPL